MAKKDKVTFINGGHVSTVDTVNVHYRVGQGGENRPDDVMLVQTLFRLIAYNPRIASTQLGVSIAQVPEITGSCDARTLSCIRAFQRANRSRLLNPYDGLIHPASYENRRVVAGGVQMAITLLSGFASEALLMRNIFDSEIAADLAKFEPRLKCALM